MTRFAEPLGRYVAVLEEAADTPTQANDRPMYTAHLAAAARMFRAIQDGSVSRLRTLVADERCYFGKSFLAGDAGLSAESAFDSFAKLVEAA